MSFTLVSSAYIEDKSSKIRDAKIPWEHQQRSAHITNDELALIKKVSQQTKFKHEALLLSDGQTYVLLYLQLLKKLQQVDCVQSILVLMADALTDHEERVPLLLQTSGVDPDFPYLPLLRAFDVQDEFIQLKSAQVLTIILSSGLTPLPLHHLHAFLKVLAGFIQGSLPNRREIGVLCAEALLSRPETRQAVWALPGIITGFINILKHQPSPQMSYQVGFCLWLLSFEQNIAGEMNKQYDVIPLLIEIAQGAVKEKVIRVIVATFRNLIVKAPLANLPTMLVAQLLPFSKNLCSRKWTDEDILEDARFLRDELSANFQSLTTYDQYTSELISGHLSWTPVHESEDFWRENASKLNDKDYEQLRVLLKLLESGDPIVLAVAVHDVGQYVKHYERGKKVVTDLGGKSRAMELITHENPEIQYRALLTVQQLISHPWVV
ncbi:ARM repeat-containing protein [Pluteus cervinus]|uniref:ARM repeat-containing protein n=1 Tax=Pluteus cervinus TaxID=181527 RepID=A0ACD3AQT8_9AGAR|nr:ARM repeat-containing protein [Pluteus cervinus]